MNKKVLTKYVNIATFIMGLDALVKVITDNVANLKVPCILLLVYFLFDIARDIWESKAGDK